MKLYGILNGCSRDVAKQAKQLNGFIEKNSLDWENEYTIIICDGTVDGDDKRALTEMAPTKSVIFVLVSYYNPEKILDALQEMIEKDAVCIFGSNYSGQELAVRFGTRMQGSSLTGVIAFEEKLNQLYGEKMVYSNHMKGRYLLRQMPYCIAMAKGLEELEKDSIQHQIQELDIRNRFIEEHRPKIIIREQEATLENQEFVLLAGRGVCNKENLKQMEQIADRMGAAFGVSRPVAMNAWTSMDKLVGVSGAMLKSKICIAAGISGAPAFYAGIEKVPFIVSVNIDEKAPLIKKSDVAVSGDCLEILEELAKYMEK